MLQARGIDVRFGDHHAVNDVDLEVPSGSIVGLIGPNGAGKTTTFNAICGVQSCNGTVVIGGSDASSLPPHKRAELGLGRTFQRLEVFGSMTAEDNLRVAAELRAKRERRSRGWVDGEVDRVLNLLGIQGVATRRADELPTGQARLVELGRALASAPKVILLDEPASGLDDVETARLDGVLRELADEGIGILLVEHDIDLVMGICSQINVLDFGRVIASGPPAAVRTHRSVIDAYLGTSA